MSDLHRTRRMFRMDEEKVRRDIENNINGTASLAVFLYLLSLVMMVIQLLFTSGTVSVSEGGAWVAFTTVLLWVLTLPWRALNAQIRIEAEEQKAADLLAEAEREHRL